MRPDRLLPTVWSCDSGTETPASQEAHRNVQYKYSTNELGRESRLNPLQDVMGEKLQKYTLFRALYDIQYRYSTL